MEPTSTIGAIVGLLGAIGGGVAWFVRRRDTRKDPIPKDAAAVALAQSATALMQGVADRLDSELGDVRKRMNGLETDIARLTSTLGAAIRYIERLLRWDKTEARGPRPPLPPELYDLIDPSLHD